MHERREEYADALRCYQRALRCDPQSSTIARAIVPVAVRLKRYLRGRPLCLEGRRIGGGRSAAAPPTGPYLAEEGDWARALTLYEKALAAREPTARKPPPTSSCGWKWAASTSSRRKTRRRPSVSPGCSTPSTTPTSSPWTRNSSKCCLGKAGSTYQLMGECFLSADRPQEALAVFEKAEQAAPDKALRQFNLARVYAKTGKPAEALDRAWRPPSPHILSDQGLAPYETLADLLASLGKKGELLEPAGETPRRRAGQPAAGLLSGGAVSSGRQARQGRNALPRTAQGQADAASATAASSNSIGRASGSTPCWTSSARPWKRPACWISWGPRRRPSRATPQCDATASSRPHERR